MPNVNAIVLPETALKVLVDAVKSESNARNKLKKCSDTLLANGVSSYMLAKPKQGETNKYETLHNQINDSIVATFTDNVQKVLTLPMASLSDEQKETRRYWRKQQGSLFSKIRSHLARTEKDLAGDSTARTPKTKLDRIYDKLVEVRDIVEKWENPELDNVTKFLAQLDELIAESC